MISDPTLAQTHERLMLDSHQLRQSALATMQRSMTKVTALASEIEASRHRLTRSRLHRGSLLPLRRDIDPNRRPAIRDPRWILLTEQGDYATLAWRRDLDDEHIAAAEMALAQMGRAGWLAVMSDAADSDVDLEIIPVRSLGNPSIPFNDAVNALQRARF